MFGLKSKRGGIIPRRSFMEIGEGGGEDAELHKWIPGADSICTFGEGGGEAVVPIETPSFVKCDYCGSLYATFQTNCENCGAPLPEPREVLRYPRGDGLGYVEFPLRPAIRRSRIL